MPRKFATAQQGGKEHSQQLLWLLGQPQLDDYLDFVKRNVVGGDALSPRLLVDEWRAANDFYYDLERTEAGLADTAECLPLASTLEELAKGVESDPYFRAAFGALPTAISMVELDKLIVCQSHIATAFSVERGRALGTAPSAEALFDFCLPTQRENPPVQIRRLSSDRYHFSSASNDLRAFDPALLGPNLWADIESHGPIAGVLGIVVGFGPNFMTAIRSDNRLLLHNGYHRAYALRALGITHAPCIVETVTRTSELAITASESITRDPAFYFRARRPPMLKDFFNPALVKQLAVRPMQTTIEIELKVSSWTTAEL